MKKKLVCLSLIFAMTAAQVLPVSAARKDDLQAQKAATQSKPVSYTHLDVYKRQATHT